MSRDDVFQLGIEVLLQAPPDWFCRGRLGLLANQASVNRSMESVKKLILDGGGNLRTIFSPQHGYYSEKQANMIESNDWRDPETGLPVISLYAQTRYPTLDALKAIDILLIDLQDVGTRVYTYTATMGHCLEAAACAGVKVVILDRPNPINGTEIEGNLLEPEFSSFVGRYQLPMRHGMTMGEFARFICAQANIDCDLGIVSMKGWRRSRWFDDLGRDWIYPSPNMPTWDTALLYPGMVLLEGTNISEGRGTTLPFKLFGAPFMDRKRFLDEINEARLEGMIFRPVVYEPVFNKYAGEPCFGFQIHITDKERFKPYRTGLAILRAFVLTHPDRFVWLDPPYEYEMEKLPIDILIGSETIRRKIEHGHEIREIESDWEEQLGQYFAKREPYLLYD